MAQPRGFHIAPVLLYSILMQNHAVRLLSIDNPVELDIIRRMQGCLRAYLKNWRIWNQGNRSDLQCRDVVMNGISLSVSLDGDLVLGLRPRSL